MGLLTKKARAKNPLNAQKNLFIQTAKIVDTIVIGVETLKYWQYFKVYRMPLDKYLEEERIKIFKKEVELLTGV